LIQTTTGNIQYRDTPDDSKRARRLKMRPLLLSLKQYACRQASSVSDAAVLDRKRPRNRSPTMENEQWSRSGVQRLMECRRSRNDKHIINVVADEAMISGVPQNGDSFKHLSFYIQFNSVSYRHA